MVILKDLNLLKNPTENICVFITDANIPSDDIKKMEADLVSLETKVNAKFYKVDVNELNSEDFKLLTSFTKSVPTLYIFNIKIKETSVTTGTLTTAELENLINRFVNKN